MHEPARALKFFERGRARWPGLSLSYNAFIELVRARLAQLDAAPDAAIFAEDLFLVAACQTQVPGAVDAFDALTWPELKKHLRKKEKDPARLDEMRQTLLVRLFVPDSLGGEARIAGYTGRGALLAWLRMAAVRLAVSAHRQENRLAGLADAYAENSPSLASDIELSFIRGRYEADFIAALRAAMGELSDEQRLLLQFRYREEMTSDQIAVVLKTSRVTAHRRVATARDALAKSLREKLSSRLQLSESGLGHLLGLLSSRLVPALTAELRDGLT
jgi:RNA polymerase sigma-70 factor (ECF subfamily)